MSEKDHEGKTSPGAESLLWPLVSQTVPSPTSSGCCGRDGGDTACATRLGRPAFPTYTRPSCLPRSSQAADQSPPKSLSEREIQSQKPGDGRWSEALRKSARESGDGSTAPFGWGLVDTPQQGANSQPKSSEPTFKQGGGLWKLRDPAARRGAALQRLEQFGPLRGPAGTDRLPPGADRKAQGPAPTARTAGR